MCSASVAYFRMSVSSARAELMLNVIGSDTATLREHSANIDARLGKVVRELSTLKHLTSAKDSMILQIEQLAAAVASSSNQSTTLFPGLFPTTISVNNVFDYSVAAVQSHNKDLTKSDHGGAITRGRCMMQGEDQKTFLPPVGTILDRSPHFSPATYTTFSPVPSLIITSFWQIQQTRTSRTNHYHVLYSKSLNTCHQLTVSIRFHVLSKFWTVSKITKEQYQCRESAFLATLIALPQTLQDMVCQTLAATDNLSDQTHISLALSNEGSNCSRLSQEPPLFQKPVVRPRHLSELLDDRSIITSLEDLGCALYSEREVHVVASFEPPKRFLSIVAGNLVEEVKCTRSPPYPSFLYNIQAFHCLDGIAGVLNLQGVVIDSSRKHIRSYLLRLPKTKCVFFLDRLSEECNGSWEDREIWAHRLIEAVRQVHARGYTIGYLQACKLPIIVDSYDTLYISRLQHITVFTNHQDVVLPPEYRRDTCTPGRLTHETNAPRVTPKLDIYQLGSCLWVLAQSWAGEMSPNQAYQHALDGFPGSSLERGKAELPPLPEQVPAFYRDMVEACRRQNPDTRPSAHQLLAMFPRPESDHKRKDLPSIHPPLDVQTYLQCRVANPICDICARVILENFYHCNTCAAGDYDICEKCFDAGEHCLEDDHLLIRLESSWKCPIAKSYISSVKNNGIREVVEI